MNAIAGSDTDDIWSKYADVHEADFVKALDPTALKGKRIGIVRDIDSVTSTTTPLLEAAIKVMTTQGVDAVEIPRSGIYDLNHEMYRILIYQFSEDLNAYLADTPTAVKTRSITDLIAFNKVEPHEKLHAQDLFEVTVATRGGRRNPDYIKMLDHAKHASRTDGIDRLIRDYNLSALVTVTARPAWKMQPDGTPPDQDPMAVLPHSESLGSMVNYAAIAGYPHLTVPMGMADGLPVGLSFVGPAW
ncbi:amidase family protein, partial [Mesorhizobium mediterraneum]|uniref:amidase family protein n=1 Tax=Mesorhizobium mediterraneum TaxID=43617 RepID=UPI001AEEAD88